MNIQVFRTAKETGERWQILKDSAFTKPYDTTQPMIVINPGKKYQTHIGFGGAFTESAAYTFHNLPKDKRDFITKAYFSEDGLGYNMGRTHIHSCDFSLENYTYVEENDIDLKTFDIKREEKWVIPMIKEAQKYQKEMLLLASPWSPPAWMKSNNNMNFGGKLLPQYQQSWANYYVKYVQDMRKRGIDIWAISVQNEPAATQTWDSCIYTAEEERDFVKDYLGPTVHAYDKDLKILGWDHNRDIIVERASTMLNDPKASEHLWGIANHWYVSEAFENMSVVHDLFPDKHLIFTEGCIEGGPKPLAWHTGERYGRNMFGDLNNWVEGWIEWNLILNEQGGPNHVGNFCDAPILADRQTNQLTVNSSYYYIGHFSKFIKRGARRVHVTHNLPQGIFTTAYENPDGKIVVVIQNQNDQATQVSLNLTGHGFGFEMIAHSIVSLVIA
jgi:glucosylceramidase